MKKEITQKEDFEHSLSNSISFEKLLDSISDSNPDKLLAIVVDHLKRKGLSEQEIIAKISKSSSGESIVIPANIFAAMLSPAEALVKYLKEEFELGYNEIASLINRDERGLWGSYNRAMKKMPQQFTIKEAKFVIPISIFKQRKYSILEAAVRYLVENHNLTTYKISHILNKKPSTIWSVYNRVKNKK